MLKCQLTRVAEEDLDEIWFYGLDTWGVKQADDYHQRLMQTIEHVAESPLQGCLEAEILEDLRSYPSGSHRIYYLVELDYIIVVRVLHQSMNATQHLDGDNI